MSRIALQAPPVKVPEIRKGDTVIVLSGKDAGKRGTVGRVVRRTASRGSLRSVFRRGTPSGGVSVVVEGVNIARRHTKPRQSQGRSDRVPKIQQGGILEIAMPMAVSKVMVICPKCDRPARIAHTTLENGARIRVCGHADCGAPLEVKGS